MALMSLSTKYVKLLAGISVALFVMVGIVFLVEGELSRPWKKNQRRFNKIDRKLTLEEISQVKQQSDSDEKKKKLAMLEKRLDGIKSRGTGIKQLWLTDFNITDRCMTCHAGVEYPRFADVAQKGTVWRNSVVLSAMPGRGLPWRRTRRTENPITGLNRFCPGPGQNHPVWDATR